MSMHLRQAHHALIRSLGMDPFTANFSKQELDRHSDIISYRVRTGWEAEFWAHLMDVEEREVPENGDGLRAVLFQAPGESEIGMVDINRCVFERDPRLHDDSGMQGVRFVKGGFLLPPQAPEPVWLRYRPPAPVFSLAPWDSGTGYLQGDPAYDDSEGDSYVALRATENERPTDHPDAWARQEFPEFLALYVKWGGHADMMSEDEMIAKSERRAQDELERLRDLWVEQSGSGRKVQYGRS